MNTTYYTSAPYIVFDIHLIAEIDVGFFRHKDTDNGLYFCAGVPMTGQALKMESPTMHPDPPFGWIADTSHMCVILTS